MSGFGAQVREARHEMGLTLIQLAREVEIAGRPVDPSYLSRIERGDATASPDQEHAIRLALGLPPPAVNFSEPEFDVGELGPRLRDARKALRMTLVELCAKVRALGEPADYSDLAKYEKGAKTPSLKKLQAIATALEVPVSELVGGETSFVEGDRLDQVEREIVKAWRTDGLPGLMMWCAARSRREAE